MDAHLFYYLFVISASALYVPGADVSRGRGIHLPQAEMFYRDSIIKANLQGGVFNASQPCENGGECACAEEFGGGRCETPTWCTWGRCGFENDAECVWDRTRKRGECRCRKENYHYLPKDRKCYECDCGAHGRCRVAGEVLVCECEANHALKAGKCEPCDCDPKSERCAFDARGEKACQCQKGYAPKTTRWSSYGTWCEICDCGESGKCRWDGDEKLCDCDSGYRLFAGKCIECDCGGDGTCRLDAFGWKECTCDYGYAEKEGRCQVCDCNYSATRRIRGVNCSFVDGSKSCVCPPGFEAGPAYCEDINECYTSRPCPPNTICTNRPGTFECACRPGYRPIRPDPKTAGCEDIDECSGYPCESPATRCVNSPGSFDCVCRAGYYASSGTHGASYKPAYNACYPIETQWREATLALGVILAIGILWISCYIMKHKSSS